MATSHQEKNVCCDCLDFCPKMNMLLCSHSLCADCCGPTCPGSAWVSCPVCRTHMPVEERSGVSPTEANPLTPNRSKTSSSNMIPPSSSKTEPSMPCSQHQGHNLCAVCEDCDAIVCKICRQEKHTDHKIKCLEEAYVASKKEYLGNVTRLSVCEQYLQRALDRVLQAEQDVRERQAALKAQIRARKDILEQWIHEASVQALVTLENDSTKLIATLCGDRFILTRKYQFLEKARKNAMTLLVADASDDTDPENRKGEEKKGDIKTKLLRLMSNLPCLNEDLPVLGFHDLAISSAAVSEFIGTVAMTPFVPTLHDSLVSFKLAFKITEDSETKIHAVCPTKNRVWVSCGSPGREVVSLYEDDGEVVTSMCVECGVNVTRMTDHWVLAEGRGRTWFFSPHSALQWRYGGPAKLCRVYGKQNSGFYLCVHQNRLCDFRSLTIEGGSSDSDQPVITGTKICDLMLTTLPVAMDVSAHGNTLAVLAEDNDHVLLFNVSDTSPSEPYLTFIPPGGSSSSFKPRDLCFFSGFAGQECLVIADWLNDVLVLLHVTEESCALIGYLGAGCPLVVKPTALAADQCGRLWIGCSSGQLVVMEQKDPTM